MILDKSIIICYSPPEYDKLTEIFISTLISIGIKKTNIDISPGISKIKHLIDVLETNKNCEYYICCDSNTMFIKNNKDEWNNLEEYIKTNNHDIYFMLKDKKNIDSSFFIIKNNKNIHSIISFLKHQTNINKNIKNINKINYGFVPNQYVINEGKIYNEHKSLFEHPLTNKTFNDTLINIKYIMEHFNSKEIKKITKLIKKPKIEKYETEIVVARYNEDLSWLEQLPKDIKITIYNKGKDDIKYPYIKLPNIGRESHTYMYHIVENYNNLAEMTIFCQGNSIEHNPDFINLIKNKKYFEDVQPLSAYYSTDKHPPLFSDVPPKFMLEATKNLHIKGNRVFVEYLDYDFITQYPYFYKPDNNFSNFMKDVKKEYDTDNIVKFNINRLKIRNVDLTKLIPSSPAALLAIKKK